MEVIHQCRETGYQVQLIRGLGAERDRVERELLEAGVALPLSQRSAWSECMRGGEPWFLLVRDEAGQSRGGVAIEVNRSRALPGHFILRTSKLGPSLPEEVRGVALEGLAQLARRSSRALRLQVNVFSRDRRAAIGVFLSGLGFREVDPPSSYRHTLVLDLQPAEDEIFAALHKTARKNIRDTMKSAVAVEAIIDPMYAGRLNELQQESMQRTGGLFAYQDWAGKIELSRRHPDLSRIVGLFVGGDIQPSSMVAFGWVCSHGDHAEYREAGSTRRTEIKGSLSYVLMWDLIRWAKAGGATWFDLGGVTLGESADDPLEGISDFKRYFSRNVVEIGSEWVLEPSPLRARVAGLVAGGASRLREWRRESNSRSGDRSVKFKTELSLSKDV